MDLHMYTNMRRTNHISFLVMIAGIDIVETIIDERKKFPIRCNWCKKQLGFLMVPYDEFQERVALLIKSKSFTFCMHCEKMQQAKHCIN